MTTTPSPSPPPDSGSKRHLTKRQDVGPSPEPSKELSNLPVDLYLGKMHVPVSLGISLVEITSRLSENSKYPFGVPKHLQEAYSHLWSWALSIQGRGPDDRIQMASDDFKEIFQGTGLDLSLMISATKRISRSGSVLGHTAPQELREKVSSRC